MSADNTSVPRPQLGWPVYSQDGGELGAVKEIRGRYFSLSVPRSPDYWLEMDAIASVIEGKVTMSFRKADLGEDFIALRLPKTAR